MRKAIILFSGFLLFLSCAPLPTIEEQRAIVKAELESKYSIDVIRHPDYYFERTNPGALIVYDGFEPKKNYLIIGKISIIQLPDARAGLIKKEVEDKVAAIGGNAILINEKIIGKKVNKDTIGIFMPQSLLKYFQVTTKRERVLKISYYGYVVRWRQ